MTYAVDGAVATITMRTPSLGLAAKQMLLAAVTEAGGDDGVRAVVLTGSGRVFTAGQDLREHADALRETGPDAFDTIDAHYNPLITALATMAKRRWPRSTAPAPKPASASRSPATCGSPRKEPGSPPRSPASG